MPLAQSFENLVALQRWENLIIGWMDIDSLGLHSCMTFLMLNSWYRRWGARENSSGMEFLNFLCGVCLDQREVFLNFSWKRMQVGARMISKSPYQGSWPDYRNVRSRCFSRCCMTKVGPLLELGHHQEVQLLFGVLTFQNLVQLSISLIFGEQLFWTIVVSGNRGTLKSTTSVWRFGRERTGLVAITTFGNWCSNTQRPITESGMTISP